MSSGLTAESMKSIVMPSSLGFLSNFSQGSPLGSVGSYSNGMNRPSWTPASDAFRTAASSAAWQKSAAYTVAVRFCWSSGTAALPLPQPSSNRCRGGASLLKSPNAASKYLLGRKKRPVACNCPWNASHRCAEASVCGASCPFTWTDASAAALDLCVSKAASARARRCVHSKSFA
eukprot:scaffold2858_cov659-Pavlova_lutheri.AAC.215